MASHATAVSETLATILAERNITVRFGHEVVSVVSNELICSNDEAIPFDECVWCTQAGAQQWLRDTGLDLDKDGFIHVDPHLQTSIKNVFACGDVAALSSPRPKAGVFAVKAGPPLTGNLRRVLTGDTALERYAPRHVWFPPVPHRCMHLREGRGHVLPGTRAVRADLALSGGE